MSPLLGIEHRFTCHPTVSLVTILAELAAVISFRMKFKEIVAHLYIVLGLRMCGVLPPFPCKFGHREKEVYFLPGSLSSQWVGRLVAQCQSLPIRSINNAEPRRPRAIELIKQ
jgi:hypothetical protein